MARIVNIYTSLEKKQSIIKDSTVLYSDLVTTENGQIIVDFVQVGNVISSTDKFGNVIQLKEGELVDNGTFYYVLLEEKKIARTYSISGEQFITIGGRSTYHCVLKNVNGSTKILLEQKEKHLIMHPDPDVSIYVNNVPRKDKTYLFPGDVLDIYGVEIIIRENTIEILDDISAVESVSLIPVETESGLRMLNRKYKRSPRLIYPEPTDDLEISNPPTEPTQSTESLIKIIIPPITMATVTILTGIFMNRGPYMYVMLITTFITLGMSITNFFKQRKEHKEKVESRIDIYNRYLKRKLSEISEQVAKQAQSRYYHNPENELILKMAETGSSRMWEKAPLNHDFLDIRVGNAQIPLSFQVKLYENDFSEKEDALLEDAKAIRDRFLVSNYLPRTLSLTNGAVGLLGSQHIMREQIAMIINQIAFFHSYYDVEIVHVYNEEDRMYWSQFDFLPHINSNVLHARTNIFSERTRDQILTGFFQVLKMRQSEFEEKKNSGNALNFTPHFVLVISDIKQIIDHSIMSYLSHDISHLSVSVIYVDRTMKNLPEHVTTVVEYRNEEEGQVVIEKGELKQDRIELDHLGAGFSMEKLPRILAGYEHVQTLQSSIPEKVNYLEMFKVDRVEELNIPERWNSGEPRKTLSVPVGYRGSDDVVMLNLHEKAHGPHGLIAGTTGSGKSEIVQTYILSLATNFHPYDVAFLLIDYKGGGMANLFRDLPHLLGTITNLDSEQSKRALIAIKAELLQRQQLFSDNDVNHIDGYQKLFKEGLVEKPMPHLFIISDEFAELKSEQPEFMKELVSTARIGRSLGIHLILATQKPSGVVDDQIWSNSKFKLCLKVQDANDSNEMLKTPDAASITQAGRAYLQVGNNEIYELFQSAYSGSPYMVNVEKDDIRDNRIYEINELGQYELKTKDLSYGNVGKTSMSELAAVVGEIKKTFEEMKHEKVPSPWLEPLGEYITQDEYEKIDIKSEWLKFEQDNVTEQLEMIVGLTDEPQNQVQNILKLNLVNGHIGLFGSGGFGKSVMLQSLIMSLARKNTPEAIHFYILDFGQSLLSLQFLPHVADLITIDEEEKIAKWIRLMESLIKERKRLFKEVGVADITTYRQLTGEKMNRIIVVLDNYDAVRDAELGDGFDKLLMLITREGIGLGIHVVISAMRSLKYQLMANIKEKITYFQVDSSDIPSIMGRTSMKIQEIPGRGLVKQDEIYEFQTLLPNAKQTQGERIENLRTEADLMQKLWTGQRPDSIPLVPEILTYEDFLMRKTVQFAMQQEHIISVGLDFEKVESINIDLRTDGNLLIAYDNILNFQKLLNSIIKTVTSQAMLYFVDSGRCELTMFKEEGIYDNTIDGIRSLLRDVFEIYENRKCQSEDEINSSQPIILIVNDPIALVSDVISEKNEYMIIDLLEKGRRFKIFTIWNIDVEKFNDFIGPLSKVVKKNQPALIMKKGQHFPPSLSVSRINYSEREFEEGEVNFIHHNRIQRIKYASK